MANNHSYIDDPIYKEELIREYARLDEQGRREKIKSDKKKAEEKKKQLRKTFYTWTAIAFLTFAMYRILLMFSSGFNINLH